jgi:hypothetical protein
MAGLERIITGSPGRPSRPAPGVRHFDPPDPRRGSRPRPGRGGFGFSAAFPSTPRVLLAVTIPGRTPAIGPPLPKGLRQASRRGGSDPRGDGLKGRGHGARRPRLLVATDPPRGSANRDVSREAPAKGHRDDPRPSRDRPAFRPAPDHGSPAGRGRPGDAPRGPLLQGLTRPQGA